MHSSSGLNHENEGIIIIVTAVETSNLTRHNVVPKHLRLCLNPEDHNLNVTYGKSKQFDLYIENYSS
jgi:hypothetical protein